MTPTSGPSRPPGFEAVTDPRGEVLRVHVATDVWRDGRVDPELLRPVLRLAGSMFARMGPTFNLTRPTYDDVLAGRLARVPEDII